MLETIPLPVTSSLTGSLLIVLVVLSGLVTTRRAVLGPLQFGDGGDDVLRRRIRAHANLIEIAPMVILGIGLLEYAGAPNQFVLGAAIVFLIGRLLHVMHVSQQSLDRALLDHLAAPDMSGRRRLAA